MSDGITVKVCYKGEVRRFSLPHPTELSISWLTHKAALFQPTPGPASNPNPNPTPNPNRSPNPGQPSPPTTAFIITYVDDENDRVTVSTDEDVTEALRVFLASGKKTLRFDLLTDSHEGARATRSPPFAQVFIDVLNDPGLMDSIGGLLNAFGSRGAPETWPGCFSATAPGASETKENENESKAVHHFVTCDVCGMSPIIGPRFKCTVRENYDMCEACEATAEPRLPSVKIVTPANPRAEMLRKLKECGCFQQRRGSCRPCKNPTSEFAAGHPIFELWKQRCAQFGATCEASEGPLESKDTEEQMIEAAIRTSLEEPASSIAPSTAAANEPAPTPVPAPVAAPAERETATTPQANGFDASHLDAWRAELAVIAGLGLDQEAALVILPKHIRTPASLTGGVINVRGLDRAIEELLA